MNNDPMNALPSVTMMGEWPDRYGNFSPMVEHNRKVWALEPAEEIAVWRDWFVRSGNAAAWDLVDDIEAELGRTEDS